MTEAGETAEQEDVTDRIKVCLGIGQLKVADAAHLFLCKINDFLLGGLQGRLERLISHVRIVTFFGGPVQELAQKAQFLFDGRVLQTSDIIVIILFPVSFLFARRQALAYV